MGPRVKALICSCIVYVATVPWGDFGVNRWYKVLVDPPLGLGSTYALWVWAAYLLWTLALQYVLYLALASLFRGAAAWPAVLAALLVSFIVVGFPLGMVAVCLDARVVPFLYREREGPLIEWQESCRIVHAHLLVPSESRYTSLEAAGRAWFLSHATKEPGILFSENCKTTAFAGDEGRAELSAAFGRQVEPGFPWEGGFSFRRQWFGNLPDYILKTWSPVFTDQLTSHSILLSQRGGECVIYEFQSQTVREVARREHEGCPVISSDSDVVGSLAGAASSKSERRVLINSAAVESSVDISQVGPGLVGLVDISTTRKTLLLRRQSCHPSDARRLSNECSSEFLELGLGGNVLRRLSRADESSDGRLLVDGSNWVWWPAFTPWWRSCCAIEWNVAGKAGKQHVARGRMVVSVSLSSDGQLVAASVTDLHKTSHVPDSVYVFRTSDGKEVFRRRLPAFSESRVQFLGRSLLAYTAFDGTDGFVRVVKVPESARQ